MQKDDKNKVAAPVALEQHLPVQNNYGIYAPMIYTAPCVMFLMWADTLRGQVGGGWALEMESFLGPVKWHRADS